VSRMRVALGALVLLAAGCGGSVPNAAETTPASNPTVAPAVVGSLLQCQAQAASKRPRDHTTVMIRVHTVARAWVTATDALAFLHGESAAGRANALGQRTLRFRVGDAAPGALVVIAVHVSRGGKQGACRASFRPRRGSAAPTQPTAPTSTAPSPPPTSPSCYPLSNEGTCYEPGEFCRNSDHGVSGIAGDGERILCADNNGWRWEPA
jgi:hypothetical protein